MKGLPAFDDFNMKQPEPDLFGNKTTAARHFTNFSLQQSTGDKNAEIDSESENGGKHDECHVLHRAEQQGLRS